MLQYWEVYLFHLRRCCHIRASEDDIELMLRNLIVLFDEATNCGCEDEKRTAIFINVFVLSYPGQSPGIFLSLSRRCLRIIRAVKSLVWLVSSSQTRIFSSLGQKFGMNPGTGRETHIEPSMTEARFLCKYFKLARMEILELNGIVI